MSIVGNMTNDDFKKLLNESIKPLKEDLDGVKEELKEVKNTQEQKVLPPLVYIETTVKSYADRYATNEDHMQNLCNFHYPTLTRSQ